MAQPDRRRYTVRFEATWTGSVGVRFWPDTAFSIAVSRPVRSRRLSMGGSVDLRSIESVGQAVKEGRREDDAQNRALSGAIVS